MPVIVSCFIHPIIQLGCHGVTMIRPREAYAHMPEVCGALIRRTTLNAARAAASMSIFSNITVSSMSKSYSV